MTTLTHTSFLGEVFEILITNKAAFLHGMITTLQISITATILGFLLGLAVAMMRGNKIGNIIATIYITIFRGTPMMVQAMVIFYGTSMLIPGFKWANIPNGSLIAGIFVVTINTGAYMSETIRSGIQSLDKGQFEAAKSLGFTRFQTMVTIILPQAIKNVIPAIGNELIVNIKDTSVLNVIAVTELFFISSGIAGATYKVFQTFTITSAIYLLLTTISAIILRVVEHKLDKTKRMRTSIPASSTTASQLLDVE